MRLKTKSSSNLKLRLAFGSAVLTLLVVGAISYRAMVMSIASAQRLREAHVVLEDIENLRSAIQTMESSYRAFVIGGNERFARSCREDILGAQQAELSIAALTADNAVQQRQIPSLKIVTDQMIQHAERVIDLRRKAGLVATAAAISNGRGRQMMAEFETEVDKMRDEELRLLVLRESDAQRRPAQTKVILPIGILLGVLIAAAAGWSVQRENTARGIAEDALFAEKERAEVTLNSIGDAVICTDVLGNATFLNLVAQTMTGWSGPEAAGKPITKVLKILDPSTRQNISNPIEMAMAQNRTIDAPNTCILVRRDGTETPIDHSVSPIHRFEGHVTGAAIVFRDVSAARAMTLQMTHSAQHDFLTGLPNRLLLNDRINQAIVLAVRSAKKVGVLFLDLDGFKHINDSLGHLLGDKLLQSVAGRLSGCVRGSDTVSRQGGDEFVVLLTEMAQSEDAALTARRMLQLVAEVHSIDLHDLHITVSIGVSVYPDDGLDAETLVKNADTAMYQAKDDGREGYKFFTAAMNVRAVRRQSIEESLRRALERHEFSLLYQPKIRLGTGEITGAEALIRWVHPIRGMVSPAEFIPIAEDCGLIVPIGKWVLREACKQARAWRDLGLPVSTMAVNISAMEFRNEEFLEGVFAVLEETGLDPRSLELELTESVLMKRPESTRAILHELRATGIQVAVDDFGTGYSSLSYLRKFPIDAIKIDQSFVRMITTAPDDTTIVTAIISMGRSLHLRVVAEGVETVEELSFLQSHECDEVQGYFFSRPVSSQQFAELLKSGIAETIFNLPSKHEQS